MSGERDKWEFPRHRLQFVCILGEGCFGQVWKAHILGQEDSKPVAVKTLKGKNSHFVFRALTLPKRKQHILDQDAETFKFLTLQIKNVNT